MTAAPRSKWWVLWLVLAVLAAGWTVVCVVDLFYPTTGEIAQLNYHLQRREEYERKANDLARQKAPAMQQLRALEEATDFARLVNDDKDNVILYGSLGGGGLVAMIVSVILMVRARRRSSARAA